MVFNSVVWKITGRVLLMVLTILGATYLIITHKMLPAAIVLGFILLFQIGELIRFNLKTNVKLTRFFESIQYSDFSSSFTVDNKLGQSYKDLNQSLNNVIGEFKKTRQEKEEQMLFLQIILQHIPTGIISFDEKGQIGLVNNAAKHLLQLPQFKNISDLAKVSNDLLQQVQDLKPGKGASVKINASMHLTIRITQLKMGGKKWSLLSLQNIHSELKQNELNAWQNLTKVLRHEIMNSIAPIATLVGSLRTVLLEDVHEQDENYLLEKEGHADLKEGLETIENRSKGLINFVNIYRDYTSIPEPVPVNFSIQPFLESISTLLKNDLGQKHVEIKMEVNPPDLQLRADREQIQMILINLIKNSKEALENSEDKIIFLKAGIDLQHNTFIQVTDRGPGILPNALEDIFVPFYTTKKNGSGIGLAISRQIMNMHKGSLSVHSVPHIHTSFTLHFG
jgi:nitrogen fixation/metabolism regulation signal transduction histidine kinase